MITFLDSLTQKKLPLPPTTDSGIFIYLCGPTVYDKGHLGHARSAVAFDLIRRYLLYRGHSVVFVSNYTDVDDKMIARATQRGISVAQLAEEIIPLYERDYKALQILPADETPRATQGVYIKEMISLIEKLLAGGHAYETSDGIYFSVRSFPEYGKLSKQKLDELSAGARVEVDDKKKDPLDFALWKKEKPGEPAWDGPAGMRGRPGWHIECSAMSLYLLAKSFGNARSFFIHGGGQDLIFPHHEDERAQSEAAQMREPFVDLWLHNGFIRINEEKMSKSLGNFFTIEEVLKKYNPLVVRYFLLATHYRMPIDFSDEVLEQAKNSLERLQDFMRRLKRYTGPGGETQPVGKNITDAKAHFSNALDNDFEVVQALAVVFDFVRDMNRAMDEKTLSLGDRDQAVALMAEFDEILAVLGEKEELLSEEVEKMIRERNQARAEKNFARSDEIREELRSRGIELEDTPQGTIWKKTL